MEEALLKLKQHFLETVEISEEEWEYISQHFTYKRLKKHQFLIQEGSNVPNEFWIVKGLVKSYFMEDSGKEHILQFAFENYWVSDFQAYQNHGISTLNIDCIEDAEFLVMSFEDREKMCEKVPALANFFRIKSTKGYISLQQRVMGLMKDSAEKRYNDLVQKLPDLIQRVPKKYIASYLGVSRETLSRFSK
ncbi:Crp/Fnr family transcriptional regulator [Flammeovirga yaeyamensis]|uniref:Crp/Fnr family transcriptional regulator n=1 Tax=Flammeovirga yaeyamensis TaxID=367791 RepID=A0AAX1N608_9BACT|nr:Crp/Fnr family transcriptional regulator [Flammeovirga yaeyamensis]MBB3701300.1 CRP-like cAMP-binding protein [Flammeovirga yaeyamensis]NMF38231.1 Crp/Fnr family transcriptional regulator [Flammeovirga yaeyamensis]QWG02642.1 Crp/Fnr family transcriptional regulator [Flammeovirga yaeyamensis]